MNNSDKNEVTIGLVSSIIKDNEISLSKFDQTGAIYILNEKYTVAPINATNYTTKGVSTQKINLKTIGKDTSQPEITFTVDKNLSYIPGQRIIATYNEINYIIGAVKSYSDNKLVMGPDATLGWVVFGAGLFSDFTITLDEATYKDPVLSTVTFKYRKGTNQVLRITPLIFEQIDIPTSYEYSFKPITLRDSVTNLPIITDDISQFNIVQRVNTANSSDVIVFNPPQILSNVIFYPNEYPFRNFVFFRGKETGSSDLWYFDFNGVATIVPSSFQAQLTSKFNYAFRNKYDNFITPYSSKNTLTVNFYNNYKLKCVGDPMPKGTNPDKINNNEPFVPRFGNNVLLPNKTYVFGWKDGVYDTLQAPSIPYLYNSYFPSIVSCIDEITIINQSLEQKLNTVYKFNKQLGFRQYPISFYISVKTNPGACKPLTDSNLSLIPKCPPGTKKCSNDINNLTCWDPANHFLVTTYFDKNRSYCPETGEGRRDYLPYNIGTTRVFPTNDSFSSDFCGTAMDQNESFKNMGNNYDENNEESVRESIIFFIFIIVSIFLIYFFNKK